MTEVMELFQSITNRTAPPCVPKLCWLCKDFTALARGEQHADQALKEHKLWCVVREARQAAEQARA